MTKISTKFPTTVGLRRYVEIKNCSTCFQSAHSRASLALPKRNRLSAKATWSQRANPDRKCGSERKGMTIEGADGESRQLINSEGDIGDPGCWTIIRALETRKASRTGPLSE
jgi:hypothetical protein